MDLRKIAADLRETKRYCRREPDPKAGNYHANPAEAERQAGECLLAMDTAKRGLGEYERFRIERLSTNIAVGMKFVHVMPDLLRCYLECAAFEIECIEGQ